MVRGHLTVSCTTSSESLLNSGQLVHGSKVRAWLAEGIRLVLLPDADDCYVHSSGSDNQAVGIICEIYQHSLTFSSPLGVQRSRHAKNLVFRRSLEGCALNLHTSQAS